MIDVVIVNWNAGFQLKTCVDSLVRYSCDLVNKIIVVDNGSTDDSVDMLSPVKHLIVERLGQNQGFASGCNAGAKLATAQYVLFLNPDAAVYEHTLRQVYEFMEREENQKFGICGVRLLDEHGEVARCCSRFPATPRIVAQSLGLDKFIAGIGSPMSEWHHLDSRQVDQVIGAFFFVRRDLFIQLDGFDERFFVYYEEVDFAYRANRAGFSSFYLSDASAFHLGGGVSNQVKARRLFYTLRSRLIYARKNFGLFGFVCTSGVTLFVEPITRLLLGTVRRSGSAIKETLLGYSMLYRWLPDWTFRGKTR